MTQKTDMQATFFAYDFTRLMIEFYNKNGFDSESIQMANVSTECILHQLEVRRPIFIETGLEELEQNSEYKAIGAAFRKRLRRLLR